MFFDHFWTLRDKFLACTKNSWTVFQNIFLPVHGNKWRKAFLIRKKSFFNHFWTLSGQFSSFRQKTSGGVVKSRFYVSKGHFQEKGFF